MYGSGQSAEQICRQGDAHPVSALLPVGVQFICSPMASPLLGFTYLQVVVLNTHNGCSLVLIVV